MKKLFNILAAVLLTVSVFAQSPEKMSYQAVIRDASNKLVTNQLVGMRVSILKNITPVYVETQKSTTNANGLMNLVIGSGTVVSGIFADINWTNDIYFIKTEIDPTGGTNYTISSTSQLLSVPYAFHAKTAGDYHLGQEKDGGIIFYIYKGNDGQEHGLIVAKTESNELWQNTGSLVNANLSWYGIVNTNKMTNSPAKTYVTGLGSGWYIPSIDELNLLWQNRFHVNMTLSFNGGTIISNLMYWSSTENDQNNAYCFSFGMGSSWTNVKTTSNSVRAIRAF